MPFGVNGARRAAQDFWDRHGHMQNCWCFAAWQPTPVEVCETFAACRRPSGIVFTRESTRVNERAWRCEIKVFMRYLCILYLAYVLYSSICSIQ